MFTYTKEKELHDYIANNFAEFFGFDYLSSEFAVSSGRIDMLGTKDNTLYVIELKRDIVTQSTIEQLSRYLSDIADLHPDKEVIGIAAAPVVDTSLIIDDHSIETLEIKGVKLLSVPRRITFTLDSDLIERMKRITDEVGITQSRIVSDGVEKRIEEIKELLKK